MPPQVITMTVHVPSDEVMTVTVYDPSGGGEDSDYSCPHRWRWWQWLFITPQMRWSQWLLTSPQVGVMGLEFLRWESRHHCLLQQVHAVSRTSRTLQCCVFLPNGHAGQSSSPGGFTLSYPCFLEWPHQVDLNAVVTLASRTIMQSIYLSAPLPRKFDATVFSQTAK